MSAEASKPEIYPVYWSSAQMEARQHPRMATVQAFLNSQWISETDGHAWFDPNQDSLYPDRIRRRPPGADSGGLGTHLDPGTLDLWMTEGYQQHFRHLFSGDFAAYDPWDASYRTEAAQYPGSTMCSAFRTFQGWTALSEMRNDQGVLHTVPIPKAMAYLMLRPLLSDVAEDDMCSVQPNRTFPASEQWHSILLRAVSSIPSVQPGDSVWWHCDMIHSVAPVTDQQGWGNVMYIPAAPWCAKNEAYAGSGPRGVPGREEPVRLPGGGLRGELAQPFPARTAQRDRTPRTRDGMTTPKVAGQLPTLDLVRQLTDRHVIEQLLATDTLTRAELAARTGISKPTASESVRRLLDVEILEEAGRQLGKRGPAGTYYRLGSGLGVALAVSAGPDGVVVDSYDLRGQRLGRIERGVPSPIDAARLSPVLVEAVSSATTAAPGPVLSCAVSVAGPVDQATGRLVRLPNAPFLLDEFAPQTADLGHHALSGHGRQRRQLDGVGRARPGCRARPRPVPALLPRRGHRERDRARRRRVPGQRRGGRRAGVREHDRTRRTKHAAAGLLRRLGPPTARLGRHRHRPVAGAVGR